MKLENLKPHTTYGYALAFLDDNGKLIRHENYRGTFTYTVQEMPEIWTGKNDMPQLLRCREEARKAPGTPSTIPLASS